MTDEYDDYLKLKSTLDMFPASFSADILLASVCWPNSEHDSHYSK